jgi:hypothetical protein
LISTEPMRAGVRRMVMGDHSKEGARHLLRRINPIVTRVLTDLRSKLEPPLQRHRPAFDRPGAHDPDADCGLLLWRPQRVKPEIRLWQPSRHMIVSRTSLIVRATQKVSSARLLRRPIQ